MRSAFCLPFLLAASACDQPEEAANQNGQGPSNLAAPVSIPAVEGQPGEVLLPETPPEDPALASLSSSRRREYERGYRDCRTGNYDYDAETQGEYYRIGCMAAENLKAGAKP